MQLGEVIRKYRKENNLTQEEVATRLGVSAPAVNKWENGNSFPDIMLLAPIARLFGISTDQLLSYQENLTHEEINQIVIEMNEMFKKQSYLECFEFAKKKVEQYPNCEQLIWQIAVILDAQRMVQEVADEDKEHGYNYATYCYLLYRRVLESQDETIRTKAADSLFGYHMRKKEYNKAEFYLSYFSKDSSERKLKKARFFAETKCMEESYKAYEELLYSNYMISSTAMHGIYMLALKENHMEKAHNLVEKQIELARCFEMGTYQEAASRLELSTMEKDGDAVIEIMQAMLASIEDISSFSRSPLYENMDFKEPRKEFIAEQKEYLKKCFQDEKTFGFLKEDVRWQEIVGEK